MVFTDKFLLQKKEIKWTVDEPLYGSSQLVTWPSVESPALFFSSGLGERLYCAWPASQHGIGSLTGAPSLPVK